MLLSKLAAKFMPNCLSSLSISFTLTNTYYNIVYMPSNNSLSVNNFTSILIPHISCPLFWYTATISDKTLTHVSKYILFIRISKII